MADRRAWVTETWLATGATRLHLQPLSRRAVLATLQSLTSYYTAALPAKTKREPGCDHTSLALDSPEIQITLHISFDDCPLETTCN